MQKIKQKVSNYSIKDLEKLSNIKAHTIRIWELRYKILQPERTDTNIRYYDDDQLKKLLNVQALLMNGMKISNVSKLNAKEMHAAQVRFYNLPDLHLGHKIFFSCVENYDGDSLP